MGRSSRPKPARLAEKLAHIRDALGLSQDGMLARLGLSGAEGLFRSSVSGYERGTREPPSSIKASTETLAARAYSNRTGSGGSRVPRS